MRYLVFIRLFAILLIIIFSGCSGTKVTRFKTLPHTPIPAIQDELRGIWVTRFDWTDKDPQVCQERIKTIMQNVAASNFNAVFFQVRGEAETLYPSPIESWSKIFNHQDPGFDPLALAIEEAHERNLKLYAYVNLLPLWGGTQPPSDTNHLYFQHGPLTGNDHSWVCYDRSGQPMALNEYYYLNPALPGVKTYLKRVIRHLVETYQIDGIHFDRIRYPGTQYVYDPYSNTKFLSDSLETGINRSEWARQTLTDLVEDVVAEALLIKPYLSISAATWGLYRTDDLKKYEHFGSGYHQYYQDAISWLDLGIMDFIVPMIYWDIKKPRPNFHELWEDFKKRSSRYDKIYPGLIVREDWIENGEIASQIHFIRQNEGLGHVLFSYRAIEGSNQTRIRDILYPEKVDVPMNLKFNQSDRVFSIDLKSLVDLPEMGYQVDVQGIKRINTTDMQSKIAFIIEDKPDTLRFSVKGKAFLANTSDWFPPYSLQLNQAGEIRKTQPLLEFRSGAATVTSIPEYHPLFKTEYPASAEINGEPVKVYKTGIFFKKIELDPGTNRILATVRSNDSICAKYEHEIMYSVKEPRRSLPLWIDEGSATLEEQIILLPDDSQSFYFNGSKGQEAHLVMRPGEHRIPFTRQDYSDYSRYRTELPFHLMTPGVKYTGTIVLHSITGRSTLNHALDGSFEVRNANEFPMIVTVGNNCLLEYSLGPIRLGSPLIAEYDSGVQLQVNGIIGNYYRVYLDRNTEGFIHQRFVRDLPKGTPRPSYYIQAISPSFSAGEDIIHIPYPEHIPYAIFPDPEQKQIRISLFGAKTSSTWIVHKSFTRLIDRISWEQVTPETYQVILHLNTSKIWGYTLQPEGTSLVFRLKYPPVLEKPDSVLPLKGLKIAIEAGHGGESTGAHGLSGLLEKDINLDLAKRLEILCNEQGMEVIQVRDRDMGMSLYTKRQIVEDSDAHLFVSIHANAGNTSRGYLRVGGTSTYYHNPFWSPFAEMVYDRLLDLDLQEFGVVGSFNYTVTRMASRPAILVEQAFMSHAEDEEKLASPDFRQAMAEKIFEGIKRYYEYMMED